MAERNVSINEGRRETLHATGGTSYYWSPIQTLRYFNTANPDAEPDSTTTYYVRDVKGGCIYDSVTVYIKKWNRLYLYNTFTPNEDLENDEWYIGNLNKYPNNKLKIYSRNGKLVFEAAPYTNNWNGRSQGEALPEATYYFSFDPGNGEEIYKGSITIIR